jgi:hypothetical protein
MTKPSLELSNGRLASQGAWLKFVERERDRAKPPKARGWMQDSEPPQTMTSASPKAMKRDASPMACAPVVHAVVTAWLGPRRPCLMEMWPEARLVRRRGTKRGEMVL